MACVALGGAKLCRGVVACRARQRPRLTKIDERILVYSGTFRAFSVKEIKQASLLSFSFTDDFVSDFGKSGD